MSNCCDELKAEVAALRAEIAKIKPINEETIIDKVLKKVELILPVIIGSVIAVQLAPKLKEITAIGNVANEALRIAKGASGSAGKALSQITGILAALAALGVSVAAINVLGNRIDTVEASLGFTDAAVSRALGLIQQVKGIATRAEVKADTANQGVADNRNSISRVSGEVQEAKTTARTALTTANEGVRKADVAQAFADRAAEIANIGVQRADRANNRLDNVEPLLDLVNQRVLEQRSDINALTNGQLRLRYDVDNLSGKISNLEIQIPGISAKASQALVESTGAKAISEIANGTAKNALQEANQAQDIAQAADVKAQAAILENAKLRAKINQLEQKDVYLEQGITQAQQEAYAALQLGGLGLVTAQNTAQGLSNVLGRVGDIGNTANNADNKADDALSKISTIKNGVVTNPASENATRQPIERIDSEQKKQADKIRRIEEKISNPGGVNTREVTRAEFEQIKQKLGEGEKLNQEGNRKIDEILQKLPYIPALTASAVAAKVPSVPQIKQAVGEVTCESARSGCIAGALGNQTNNLKQDFGQKLRDLEQGLNAGANAAQLTLLNTINTKLGAEVVGGITGSLGKFYEWAHIDRALNLLTFAATIHNGMMLSRDIGSTLTQALGNVLQVIGIKDKDGNALDVGAIIGKSIENAIKGVIGAENYAELSQNFALANRIYQSTTNVLNSMLNVSSTVLNGLEVIGSTTGKMGNALKACGAVQESAYNWFNPQPKFNRVTAGLEAFNTTASTILQVTQVPLDIASAITEFNQSSTELVNAIQNDEDDNNKGKGSPEPIKLSADNTLAKSLSAGLDLDELDLDADE